MTKGSSEMKEAIAEDRSAYLIKEKAQKASSSVAENRFSTDWSPAAGSNDYLIA